MNLIFKYFYTIFVKFSQINLNFWFFNEIKQKLYKFFKTKFKNYYPVLN